MGYSYGQNERGRWVLSCDNCGNIGGVRKRTCPHKVLQSAHRVPNGQRYSLPYCYPAALCSSCYATHKAVLHKDCEAAAAERQAEEDAIQAKLDSGAVLRSAAFGDWDETVPEGMVGVLFTAAGREEKWLMPDEAYRAIPLGVAATPDDYRAIAQLEPWAA